MKLLIVLVYCFFYCGYISAQSHFIKLDSIGIEGYIFEKEYEPSFIGFHKLERYTPSKIDIEKAEYLIYGLGLKKEKWKKKRRQYLGFYKDCNKYLLVHIIACKSEKQFAVYFSQDAWKNEFTTILVDGMNVQLSYLYMINLKDGTIGYYNIEH